MKKTGPINDELRSEYDFRPDVRGKYARSFAGVYDSKTLRRVENKMSRELNQLKEKASKLSDAERAALALALIESLDEASDPDADELWRIDRGEVQPIPGDEVMARLRRRLG